MVKSSQELAASSKLAQAIFARIELAPVLDDIFYAIEEGLHDAYTQDELTDVGNIYTIYKAVEDGIFSHELDNKLSQDTRKYLLNSIRKNTLEFNVIRRDCLFNTVSFSLYLHNNSSNTNFKFTITFEADLDTATVTSIKGDYTDISSSEFLNFIASSSQH